MIQLCPSRASYWPVPSFYERALCAPAGVRRRLVRRARAAEATAAGGRATTARYVQFDMNDRLAELRGGPVGVDIEMGGGTAGASGPMATSAFMQAFFDEVQTVKKLMGTIRSNIRLIESHHGECLIAISAEQGREATERLEGLMKETNGTATQVRNQLKAMDAENKDFSAHNQGSSEARIRTNMHGTLTRKFVDLMAEYQQIQVGDPHPVSPHLAEPPIAASPSRLWPPRAPPRPVSP